MPPESRNGQLGTQRLWTMTNRGSEHHQGLSGPLGSGQFVAGCGSKGSQEFGDQWSLSAWD